MVIQPSFFLYEIGCLFITANIMIWTTLSKVLYMKLAHKQAMYVESPWK